MNSMEEQENKVYLGDSVYATSDGWHVILTTENGLPYDPSNKIMLDPEVQANLIKYIKDGPR